LLATAVAMGAPASKDKAPAPEIYGEWEFEAFIENGVESPAATPPYRYRFNRDGTWQVFQGDKETAARRGFKFDPKADPSALDFNTQPAGTDSPIVRAIYCLDRDSLTICSGGPDGVRPTAFEAGAGSKNHLIRLRRVKTKD